MEDIQTILGLISAFLGIILLVLKIFEAWIKVSGPVKDFLSKPVVWLVVAALLLLGGYLIVDRMIDDHDGKVKVAFKTAHNRYVSAMGADHDWLLMAQASVIDDYEEFTLLCQDYGKVALQTWHKDDEGKNRYVTAMGADWDWLLRAETNVLDDYEKFTLLDADTGEQRPCLEVVESLKDDGEARIALQTWHKKEDKNRLVTAMDVNWDWKLRAETNELRASEKFTVTLISLP
jgi:hypothetical protein